MPLIPRSMPGAQSAPSQISRDYRPKKQVVKVFTRRRRKVTPCPLQPVLASAKAYEDCNAVWVSWPMANTEFCSVCRMKGLMVARGGGNSLRPYSQQRPMRTNLSCCPGLIDNGQYKSTNRLLVVVPHERPHGIMRILKNLCMLLPKALKTRAIKDTMALVADSTGGTKGAPA